jgi:predicted nuclease with TOPRIM domain
MSADGSQNGWNEYSKLVLKELESLASAITGVNEKIQEIKNELTEIRARESKIDELKKWKEKIDEISSPTQLKETINKVDDLNAFKIKAITVFAVVQFGMAFMLWYEKFIQQ